MSTIIDNRKPFDPVAYLREQWPDSNACRIAAEHVERRMKGAERRVINVGETFIDDSGRLCLRVASPIDVPRRYYAVLKDGSSGWHEDQIVGIPVTVTITVDNA